jgi:hypothetical protein
MSVASEKLLYQSYALKMNIKQKSLLRVFKYISKPEIELPSYCACYLLKRNIMRSLPFEIGNTSPFFLNEARGQLGVYFSSIFSVSESLLHTSTQT